MLVSPVDVSERKGGFAARAVHVITDPTRDLERFCTFISGCDLTSAVEMCRERLSLAPEGEPAARWTKDLTIALRIGGDFQATLDLLASRYQTALLVGGAFAGRYEASFGQAYTCVGRFNPALEHLTAARFYFEETGEHLSAARVDTNTGRCLTSANRPEDSHSYFERALRVAEENSDLLLQGEIWESRALAFEAQQKYEEGFQAAALSVSILAPTNYEAAFIESSETRTRLARMRGQG